MWQPGNLHSDVPQDLTVGQALHRAQSQPMGGGYRDRTDGAPFPAWTNVESQGASSVACTSALAAHLEGRFPSACRGWRLIREQVMCERSPKENPWARRRLAVLWG